MGAIADVVPNHMCIDQPANEWWWDVLENGPSSQFAHYFDIDWNPPKRDLENRVLLPILGDSHIDMTNQQQVDTFVAMMKEVARYAEKYDVLVGLEDWISAEDNIRLLDAIGSDSVAVYYDAHNLVARVKDVYT